MPWCWTSERQQIYCFASGYPAVPEVFNVYDHIWQDLDTLDWLEKRVLFASWASYFDLLFQAVH